MEYRYQYPLWVVRSTLAVRFALVIAAALAVRWIAVGFELAGYRCVRLASSFH